MVYIYYGHLKINGFCCCFPNPNEHERHYHLRCLAWLDVQCGVWLILWCHCDRCTRFVRRIDLTTTAAAASNKWLPVETEHDELISRSLPVELSADEIAVYRVSWVVWFIRKDCVYFDDYHPRVRGEEMCLRWRCRRKGEIIWIKMYLY